MDREYICRTEKGLYYVTGTRMPLAVIVYAFREGASPESIQQDYPALSLEQIYGAITFCLAHREEVDAYLALHDGEAERLRHETPALPVELSARLRAARTGSVSRTGL